MNKVTLMGRITHDLELKTVGDNEVLNFSIAVDRRFKTNGEKVTDFFNITAWNHTAEFIHEYFSKGRMIAIVGELQTRKWETESGDTRTQYEVITNEVYFTGETVREEEPQQKPSYKKRTYKR